jgi:hypothetical protein
MWLKRRCGFRTSTIVNPGRGEFWFSQVRPAILAAFLISPRSHSATWLLPSFLLVTTLPSAPLRAADFAAGVEECYAKYKRDVLESFVDDADLVCNRGDEGFIDQGDCGWRTSLFLFCLAVEGKDDKTCQRFLKSLSNSWSGGKPVRHPCADVRKRFKGMYSRDQFYPQLAAIYYCWKNGSSETKVLATDLLRKFIRVLRDNNWEFNTGEAASLPPMSRFVLREVAEQIGLADSWAINDTNILRRTLRANLQKLEYDTYRELFVLNIDFQARRIEAGLERPTAIVRQFEELQAEIQALFDPGQQPRDVLKIAEKILELRSKLEAILKEIRPLSNKARRDNPFEFYAIHNLFWQILLVYECKPATANLRKTTRDLFIACRLHKTAPLFWLAGEEKEPRDWLLNWPQEWENRNYVWQRNLAEQRKDRIKGETYPRLDYMVLRRLFDLKVRRN